MSAGSPRPEPPDSDNQQRISYTILDLDAPDARAAWTRTRPTLYAAVRRILAQHGLCSAVLFERQDDRSISAEAQLFVMYDTSGDDSCSSSSSSGTASLIDSAGKFVVNLADLQGGRPREVAPSQEGEVLRVFSRVVAVIKEQIAVYGCSAVLEADKMDSDDDLSLHILDTSFSANSSTANLLALYHAQRMAIGEADSRKISINTKKDKLDVVLGLVWPITRIPWKWIVDLGDADIQDLCKI